MQVFPPSSFSPFFQPFIIFLSFFFSYSTLLIKM